MWQCPLCQSDLRLTTSSASCENQHTFDRAKSGYLNLLPVQFKKSRQPGDDKSMLRARQTFHSFGSYSPLMDAMSSMLVEHLTPQRRDVTVFDAGCGEGTYLNTVCGNLERAGIKVEAAGGDIAKQAVDIAAKAYRQYQFVVASNVNLPIADDAVDIMLQVFAPGSEPEQARVLRGDGLLMTVEPGPQHLRELKARVYETPREHPVPGEQRSGFTLIASQPLRYNLTFTTDEQKAALLTMTPYMWKVAPQKRATLTDGLHAVTADFAIQLWRVAK